MNHLLAIPLPKIQWFLIFSLSWLVGGCDGIESKPELVSKFRTMGVGFDDPSYTYSTADASQTATLNFFFVSPSAVSIAASDLELESNNQVELTFSSPELVNDTSAMKVYRVTAETTLPSADTLIFNPLENNTAEVVYGAKFTAGSEEEIVFGSIKIYTPEVAASDSVQTPVATITSHSEGEAISSGTETLVGEVSSENAGEAYRSSWLVSSGTILDFRRRETDWEEIGSGSKTVIFTARGLDSHNFSYQLITLEAN